MIFEKSKYTTEVVPITVDFTGSLPSGETVSSSSTVTAVTTATPPVDATSAAITGQSNTTTTLSVTAKANATAVTYLLTFTAVTSPSAYKIVEYVQLTVT
jgi:hypothetical protein